MRKLSWLLLLGLLVLVNGRHASGEPENATAPKAAGDWKEDPVCRMVFYATLEGLYEDGVPSEVVDSILGRTKNSPADLKQTFVIQCPLCLPVFEAFRLYQQRSVLSEGKMDTFGKGLDPALVERLKNNNLVPRQKALKVLVERWVGRRLALLRLTAEEKEDWSRQLQARSEQGKAHLKELRSESAWYKAWSTYAGCPSCDGSTAACVKLKIVEKK